MEIKGTLTDNIECYTLSFQEKRCLFISKPDLSKLRLFSIKNQKHLIKTYPLISSLPNIKVKLDLNYLKQITSDKKINYILLTSYKEFLVLPYVYKKLVQINPNVKIFATHIMYEVGRIYLTTFHKKTRQFDDFYISPNKDLTYQEESQLFDVYYQEFGVKYQTWSYIFSQQDIKQCLSHVTKVNYGQILDAQAIKIQGYASGSSLGGVIWLFESILTKQKVLFVKQISAQRWRSFTPIFTQNQKKIKSIHPDIKDVDFLIFANKNLVTNPKKDNQSISNLLKTMVKYIQSNQNLEIIFDDQLLILDIIGYLYMQMKEKFYQLFIENPQFSKIVNYANTYVQFLSDPYRNKIYQDPPQYPYQSYMVLKQKGFTFSGTMTQIGQKQKIPLKQLILRSTPFLNFKADYAGYLEGIQEGDAIWYSQAQIFNEEDLKNFVFNINPKKIISYSNISAHLSQYNPSNIGYIQYFRAFKIKNQCCNHYLSKNISSNLINRYECVDGYIMAYPVQKQFLHFSNKWAQQLGASLRNQYRNVLTIEPVYLRTDQSQIWIQNYKIFIRTKNAKQVGQILEILQSISKGLKLR